MINSKALAIALTIGVATSASAIANAASAKSPADFQVMIEKIHSQQAAQRSHIMDKVMSTRAVSVKGPLSPAAFQKMLENIHAIQVSNRVKVLEIVKKMPSATKQVASR